MYQDAISLNGSEIKELKTTIELYPNPASSVLRFNLTESTNKMKYVITNALGSTVQNSILTQNEIKIDKLSPGFYTIKLSNGLRAKFCKK